MRLFFSPSPPPNQKIDITSHSFSMINSRSQLLDGQFLVPHKSLLCILSHPVALAPNPRSLFTVDSSIWPLIAIFFFIYGLLACHLSPSKPPASLLKAINYPHFPLTLSVPSASILVKHYLQFFALLLGQGK